MHGSVLYRDIWFDKPPLVAAVYLLWGAKFGAVLRVAGAIYDLIACVLAYLFAARMWTRREGYWAAGLLAFFLTFDTHSAVVPLAADSLLLVPHLAAVFLAARKQAFWAGVAAGVGFLFNTKGVFVLAACALFAWPDVIPLAAGFAVPNLAGLGMACGGGRVGAVSRSGLAMAGAVCGESCCVRSGLERRGADSRLAGVSCSAGDRRGCAVVAADGLEVPRLVPDLLCGRGAGLAVFPAVLFPGAACVDDCGGARIESDARAGGGGDCDCRDGGSGGAICARESERSGTRSG